MATRDLSNRPHYVYTHSVDDTVVYVGLTSRPHVRPREAKGRPWVAAATVEVSPAMSRAAAVWMESRLIELLSPRHNVQRPDPEVRVHDWRVDKIAAAEGVDRSTANRFLRYYPQDPDAFSTFLAQRAEKVAAYNARLIAGEPPEALAAEMAEAMFSRSA